MLNKRRTHLEKQLLSQDGDEETRYRSTKRTRILDAIEVPPSIHSSYSRSTRPRSVASIISEERNLLEPPQPLVEPVPSQPPSPSLREGSVLSNVDSMISLGESAGHSPVARVEAGDVSFTFTERYRGARKPRREVEWEPMDDAIGKQIDKLLKQALDSVLQGDVRDDLETRSELRKYIRASKKRISRTPIPSNARANLFDSAHLQKKIIQWEEKMGPMVNETVNICERAQIEENALDDELRELSELREDYREKAVQEKAVKQQLESLHALINIPPARDDYIIALTQHPSSKFSTSSTQ